jgi:triacylglycerol lipase
VSDADATTKYPVLFVSGIDDAPLFDWNPRIVAAVPGSLHVRVSAWAPTEARAGDVWQAVRGVLARGAAPGRVASGAATRVNLVCYAVAGIDCRYLASPAGLFADDAEERAKVGASVASITTIATPHRGTRVAEVAESAASGDVAPDVLAALTGGQATAPIGGDALKGVLDALTEDRMRAFDQTIVDDPNVFYQSFAGVSYPFGRAPGGDAAAEADVRAHCVDEKGEVAFVARLEGTRDALAPLLLATSPFAGAVAGDAGTTTSPSDGMIAVDSAKWGHFAGCVPADHYDVIGQMGHVTRDPLTGFDAPRFYRWVASGLAARGL